MEVVKYLVEVEGCDINAMDVAEGKEVPNHWGVPMAYAVHTGKGIEVVKWLLEVSSCDFNFSAEDISIMDFYILECEESFADESCAVEGCRSED